MKMNMVMLNFSPEDRFEQGGRGSTSSPAVVIPKSRAASTSGVCAHNHRITCIAVLLFFSCVLISTNAGAQAVGGSISRIEGYCTVRVELNRTWAKFFSRIPENTEESRVSEQLPVKELGVHFPQTNYRLRTFGVTLDGPQVFLLCPVERADNPVFWRCTKFGFGILV
jgi:hypothetical protein